MIEVSPEFKTAVYSPVRTTNARVTFDISDTTAAEDATSTVSSEAEISRKDQLTNRKLDRPAYATFEPDYWKLDGSFVLPPKPDETDFEVGWFSDVLSGADGVFTSYQVLDFQFNDLHSSIGLTITFDVAANEYAVDFDIDVYDGAGALIKSLQIRGNTESRYVLDEQLSNYKQIKITILKWCRADRRAKVTEVTFGVIRVYGDEKIIKLNLIEEINLTSETVPANELRLIVDNSKREFNILNPNGSYAFLQKRQAVFTELGVETANGVTEYVNMGTYYLTDWQSDEGSLTTTFIARNQIELIPDVEVENLVSQNTNLYDLAISVLASAGITKYDVDVSLQTISTQGVYKKTKYRNLLQMIAIAGQCILYVDRNDQLVIRKPASGIPVDTIDFDNIYKEPQIRLDKLVSRVEVLYYNGVDQAGSFITAGSDEGGSTLKVENTLINSEAHAQAVTEWILAESQKRALYEVNWRQNPALECGDLVSIEDVYGANKESRIIRQEYEYAGYLNGRTRSKGAV